MPTHTYHQENLREKLIEAGIQLMNEMGYEQLSLRKIATVCQVSHAAPYRHFTDKRELLSAMQQHVEQQFVSILQNAISSATESGSMLAFGKAYVAFFAQHPQYYSFFIQQKEIYVHIPHTYGDFDSNYQPFILFKEQALLHLAKWNVPKEMYTTAIVSMWASVHGLAGMATMSGVHYDGDWAALAEKVLLGASPHV